LFLLNIIISIGTILSLQPTKYELVSILNNKSNKKHFQKYLEGYATQSDLSCLQCWTTVKKLLTDLLVFKNNSDDLYDKNNNNKKNYKNNKNTIVENFNTKNNNIKKEGRFTHSLAAARSASRAIFGSGAASKTDINFKTSNNTAEYNDPTEVFKILLSGDNVLIYIFNIINNLF
jgi:hypothetical protein